MNKNYMSSLDNPYITLDLALKYLDNNVDFSKVKKEIEAEMENNQYVHPLINETIEGRCEQILFLTDNLPENYLVNNANMVLASFKMSLPSHRLNSNDEERNAVIKFINNAFHTAIKYLFENKDENIFNPFSEKGKQCIKTFAMTVAWSYTPVGSSCLGNELLGN